MKAGLRELLSYDIANGDMTQNPREETACDRIGALARADKLGAALWRVTGNMDPRALIGAREMLVARLLGPRDNPTIIRALCWQALKEWLVTLCPTCTGRRFTTDAAGVRAECGECRGSGKGRHSDSERMRVLGVGRAGYERYAPMFATAHSILTSADARVYAQVSRQLGRRVPKPLYSKANRK